jgi:hypothetical protein
MHPLKIQDKFSFFFVSFVSKLNCLGPSPRCLGTRHDTPPRPPFCRAADSCVIIARPPSCRGIVACTPIGVLLHPRPPLCRCTRPAPPCVSLHAPPLRVGARTPLCIFARPTPACPLHASSHRALTFGARARRHALDELPSITVRARRVLSLSKHCVYV